MIATSGYALPVDSNGKIIDFLDNDIRLVPKPEEVVRQRMVRMLHNEYGYPKNVLAREVPIRHGSKEAVGDDKRPVRADVVVYENAAARAARDQGRIRLVVECKSPTETGGHNQLASYVFLTSASGAVWFNGSGTSDEVRYFRRTDDNKLVPWVGLPRPKESWDALGRRKKADLVPPYDIKGLLRRCHDKLHARGAASDEEDLTLDMVRILMAKAMDEMADGALPEFYCTPEEYKSDAGQAEAAGRIRELFHRAKASYSGVFREAERITVGDRAVCDVVGEVQRYRLLSDDATGDEWDVMGHAYEEYTEVSLKRKRGQFFTNRLIVDLLVSMVDPAYDDRVLDPAGGSAGFLSGALRYVRRQTKGAALSPGVVSRRLDQFRRSLYMVEVSRRLVKVAKTAMILHGDGYAGMTQGDSLGPFEDLSPHVRDSCGKGMATVVLTNPPFAGVGDGRITDDRVLERFECGHRWTDGPNGYRPTNETLTEGAPPELLFLERCIQWLAPGGRLGIVVPKSFLDTVTYKPGRALLLRECKLLAVVTCHKNTFQPHTGVRTALLVAEKRDGGGTGDPPIYMAISRSVGQDSEGRPAFARDSVGHLTDVLDEDVTDIAADWRRHLAGELQTSDYRFSIEPDAIDRDTLNVNPQVHRPSLNATLSSIQALDDDDDWTVARLEEVVGPSGDIFKGPRLKSENLVVEVDAIGTPGVEPYFTPSAVLQERADAAKLFDIRRANPAQASTIAAIRVQAGDIVITRSGTIGRVAFVTSMFDGAIVSDDLIRVRVPDEDMRLFVWAFLETGLAYDQMMRNEYGAIQQHLEPHHVRDILVPIPNDDRKFQAVVEARRQILDSKEALLMASQASDDAASGLFGSIAQTA